MNKACGYGPFKVSSGYKGILYIYIYIPTYIHTYIYIYRVLFVCLQTPGLSGLGHKAA